MLAPLLLLWPMSLALTWLAAQGIANRPYDRALGETVHVLAQRLQPRGHTLRVELSRDTAQLLRADEVDNIYYQVLGPKGELVGGDRDLPAPPDNDGSAEGDLRLRDDDVHDDSVRVAYQWVVLTPGEAPALIQVAETLTKRSRLATEIIKGVILPQFVILPIAVLLVWLALARGLSPLNALQQRIRQRASDDLSPIDDREVPEEVTPLVQAINDLLARQHSALQTQKRFLADAAHQLKTPLAGLRMQAELAAREIDAGQRDLNSLRSSLDQMAHASQRAAHMVNQLLSMARAEAKAVAPILAPMDLQALATDVVRDFVPRAFEKSIDLGYEGPEETLSVAEQRDSTRVLGNALLLRELITNLVDNALQYTPPGGTVTVRLVPDPFGQVVVMQVEDSGPGIPQAERELVFQPFYRALGTTVDGSGLGLAIVAEIARQHGAEVMLEDAREPGQIKPGESPGSRFTFRLMRAPAVANAAVVAEDPAPEPESRTELHSQVPP
ncbi:MAG: sensor histidine kinase N-terminal domain-containing protein [Leptothrix sp. (in: b-proteobacteria)]